MMDTLTGTLVTADWDGATALSNANRVRVRYLGNVVEGEIHSTFTTWGGRFQCHVRFDGPTEMRINGYLDTRDGIAVEAWIEPGLDRFGAPRQTIAETFVILD